MDSSKIGGHKNGPEQQDRLRAKLRAVFDSSLEDPLDFRMVAGKHSWPIHSKILMQHSLYFTRRIEEATRNESLKCYSWSPEDKPADIARLIIYLYRGYYPSQDACFSDNDAPTVTTMLVRSTSNHVLQLQPESPNPDTLLESLETDLRMYSLAVEYEMEDLKKCALGALESKLTVCPQLFWKICDSVESLSKEMDPLACFLCRVAQEHVKALCDDERFSELTRKNPDFALKLIRNFAKKDDQELTTTPNACPSVLGKRLNPFGDPATPSFGPASNSRSTIGTISASDVGFRPTIPSGELLPSPVATQMPSNEQLRGLDGTRARFVIRENRIVRGIMTKNIETHVARYRTELMAMRQAASETQKTEDIESA